MDKVTDNEQNNAVESSNAFFEASFARKRVMAILRGLAPEETVAMCKRAWRAGIEVVEVPIQSDDALASLQAAAGAAALEGRTVGAGTVTTLRQLDQALSIGVSFTVAPGFDPEVARACCDSAVAHLPGVATASEVQQALRLGFSWLKVFPAAQLTPGWIRALLAPFPDARFVATGGIDGGNARDFLAAGARVVAVGSALGDPAQLELLASV
ncbi:MAG: bifunctional 4-hydroxy-2-oxoglutarate aldolase/2-dehydro-3-deoxy-phosphogluconate aldolase [Acidimicrobiales bacterium]|jgi:2-dehydro-3-deoxyphosphogluconate aldolase/(4S)-4-hydroxy-2-oxoglutarate aldolase